MSKWIAKGICQSLVPGWDLHNCWVLLEADDHEIAEKVVEAMYASGWLNPQIEERIEK